MEQLLKDPAEFASTVLLIFQMILLFLVLARALRAIRTEARDNLMVLFAFSVGCFLVNDFYWLAHALLLPGVRMPFSVSEIGDNGIFLFYSMLLSTAFPERCEKKSVFVLTALFAAANTGLWIGWSGEWVKDIVGGLVFGWFLCVAVRSLWITHALSRGEWCVLGGACLVLIAAQTAIFFVPEHWARVLDTFCYVLLFIVVLLWCVKTFLAWRKGDSHVFLSLAFACAAWISCTMYMSAGWMYFFADLCCTLMLPVELLAVRMEVAEA